MKTIVFDVSDLRWSGIFSAMLLGGGDMAVRGVSSAERLEESMNDPVVAGFVLFFNTSREVESFRVGNPDLRLVVVSDKPIGLLRTATSLPVLASRLEEDLEAVAAEIRLFFSTA